VRAVLSDAWQAYLAGDRLAVFERMQSDALRLYCVAQPMDEYGNRNVYYASADGRGFDCSVYDDGEHTGAYAYFIRDDGLFEEASIDIFSSDGDFYAKWRVGNSADYLNGVHEEWNYELAGSGLRLWRYERGHLANGGYEGEVYYESYEADGRVSRSFEYYKDGYQQMLGPAGELGYPFAKDAETGEYHYSEHYENGRLPYSD
jgi:hypothetical protein